MDSHSSDVPYVCCYRCWMLFWDGRRNTFPHTHTRALARSNWWIAVALLDPPYRIDAKSKKKKWRHRQAVDDYDVEEDLPNALKLLGEMNNNVKQVSDLVENMLQRVKTGELTTEYGLSFLEIKYHMLLTYLINLTYVVLRKCSGTCTLRITPNSLETIWNPCMNIDLSFILSFLGRQTNRTRSIHRSIDWDSNSFGENQTNWLQVALSNR